MSGLTILSATVDGDSVGVRCVEGTIEALGPAVTPAEDDEVLDAAGMLLLPPFVNGHTHAAMTLFRSYGDDLPLMEWLQTRIWPAEARLVAEDVYWGTRLAAIEMLRSGTTRLFDMYWQHEAVARAATDAGIRAVVSAVLVDGGDPSRSQQVCDEAERSLEDLAAYSPLVTPSLGPHAVYTVSPGTLAWIGERAAEDDLIVHIHLSETRGEVDDCLDAHGVRPPEHLDRLGVLGPRTVVAHGCWLEPAELALLAARATTVVTNPVSNMKLATGRAFPYLEALAAGVPLGLGTDGTSSNNNLDMLEQAKFFALLQKHTTDDPAVAPAHEVLELARGRRSDLIGGRPLAVGEPADLLLVRTDVPEMSVGRVDADLVYAASGAVVDTAVVAGKVLMRGRRVADQDEVIGEVRARAEHLTRDR